MPPCEGIKITRQDDALEAVSPSVTKQRPRKKLETFCDPVSLLDGIGSGLPSLRQQKKSTQNAELIRSVRRGASRPMRKCSGESPSTTESGPEQTRKPALTAKEKKGMSLSRVLAMLSSLDLTFFVRRPVKNTISITVNSREQVRTLARPSSNSKKEKAVTKPCTDHVCHQMLRSLSLTLIVSLR